MCGWKPEYPVQHPDTRDKAMMRVQMCKILEGLQIQISGSRQIQPRVPNGETGQTIRPITTGAITLYLKG
ncbi:hypothetical protein V7S43_004763 [Phytophthora oleae]|uniref:Uncharacterized protein n=1 Tax=Phytophthora oleae TaxID=2107226 RepID=A0ABD3FZR5_9STRA